MSDNPFGQDGEIPADIAAELGFIAEAVKYDEAKDSVKAKYQHYPLVYDAWLGRSLEFSGIDLKTNFEGHMTVDQVKKIKMWRNFMLIPLAFYSVIVFVFWAMLCVSIVVWITDGSLGFEIELYEVINVLLLSLFGIVLLLIPYTDVSHKNQDINNRIVKRAVGRIKKSRRSTIVTPNNGKFMVYPNAYRGFKHLEPYVIYYAPKSRIVLSAMPIDEREI